MELVEKQTAENHYNEFSAASGRPSISPLPAMLTLKYFFGVSHATEKIWNLIRQYVLYAPIKEFLELSQ